MEKAKEDECLFQSTLPARGATVRAGFHVQQQHISIHAPRTGSDFIACSAFASSLLFQSTLPARGATQHHSEWRSRHFDFNPRSPHGERQKSMRKHQASERHFNPRSPHGERRKEYIVFGGKQKYFNPRSPHGERPEWLPTYKSEVTAFQSTLPARGATATATRRNHFRQYFNPRSPHGERQNRRSIPRTKRNFNPRSPHGERRSQPPLFPMTLTISIHAPRTGSDRSRAGHSPRRRDFNPRSPHGERRGGGGKSRCDHRDFNPRSPHGERLAFVAV